MGFNERGRGVVVVDYEEGWDARWMKMGGWGIALAGRDQVGGAVRGSRRVLQ